MSLQHQKLNRKEDRMEDRRFIEETFPVREVSEEASKEKNIKHGHPSAFHIWWARRPLASSRAINFSALILKPRDEQQLGKTKDFVTRLSKWDNSLNFTILEQARKAILDANGGVPRKVLDPFAGGGAIPLEALRLGCETFASDYNPVATLILKCTLEYPQKYGGRMTQIQSGLASDNNENRLLNDLENWGTWVLNEARKELSGFYPERKERSIPTGYIWARTIPCQNPACNIEIPLLRRFWLAKRDTRKISLYPTVEGSQVKFTVVGTGYEDAPKSFDPSTGTISKAVVTCPSCKSRIDAKTTRELFRRGESREKMIVVAYSIEGKVGRRYRIADKEDELAVRKAERYLSEKRSRLLEEGAGDPIPDEELVRTAGNQMAVLHYGIRTFGDLFNSRQKLALATFGEKVRTAHSQMIEQGYDTEYAKVITTYLALVVSKLCDFNSKLARWASLVETSVATFARQALPIVWDYCETNPFSRSTGSWQALTKWTRDSLRTCFGLPVAESVSQCSATRLPYPRDYFDAVLTDPPYYDNVYYSNLSDFFYVWLKRIIGDLYPDLFVTPLTPKTEEIVQDPIRHITKEASRKFFEDNLKVAFNEMYRVLKPNGISVIVYAHKSTAGWETLINSVLGSRLVVTAAWPIHTEKKARLVAKESAALASSIYMIARKLPREPVGFYKEVRDSLRGHLNDKLDRLWKEGISGADFFIAAIGSSIEVFGKYDKIIDDGGDAIGADKLLEDIRKIVTDYAVKQVLHNGFTSEITPMTRFYVLWRWAYSDARVEFDDADKLAKGVGIDLPSEWNRGFIKKDKGFIEIVGPADREADAFEASNELIDVLHNVLLLWKKGKNDAILKILGDTGLGNGDVFYRVAQAIAESLANGNREKKLLEGFLQGKERISEDIRKQSEQRRLFE